MEKNDGEGVLATTTCLVEKISLITVSCFIS